MTEDDTRMELRRELEYARDVIVQNHEFRLRKEPKDVRLGFYTDSGAFVMNVNAIAHINALLEKTK